MRERVMQVVNKYIDAIRRNDAAAVPLHPEMIGEFPTMVLFQSPSTFIS